ncbi:ubiquitin carboxyl-terminal hydrolase 17-like protein C [Rattus norvegicus]|uniref:ubiquitin carboxyl-terminal hydrolase 17-like protein C n=1 Tax=Rattus norvegicus TaxID=10116 RepID=UPI001917991C|nr:ubiquitin carboxyl-terminal hydrolase 17-like protein C [Rattus norvegicus]
MVTAPSFTEDPAMSPPATPELHQDEARVLEELSAKGKPSLSLQRIQSPGSGLQNIGNSCYLNAVLQCLTHTPPLADYMLSQEHSQRCCYPEGCKMCAMEAHVTQSLLHSHSGGVMKPSEILTSTFHKHRQEDAHEFLMFTLNAMHESCLRGCKQSETSSKDSSLIYDIFGGQMRSQIKCHHCQGTLDSYDPFLNLFLDICSAQSVKQALEDLVKLEELQGDNAYYCGRCREKMPASKTTKVQTASKVLLLVLNRSYDFGGDKLNRVVSYPEYLDLQPYLSQPTAGPLPYALYAVLVHDGVTCSSGHYFCYVKASHGKWYKMDDSKVTRCDVSSVLSEPAYLLFYVQQTDLEKVNVDVSVGRVHGVLHPESQQKKTRKKKHKRSSCTEAVYMPRENRENTATKETSLGEGKVLQEQNHQKAGQNLKTTKVNFQRWDLQRLGQVDRTHLLLPREQNHQKAGQNLKTTKVNLSANGTVIHQPRYTANWGRNAPDKDDQPGHSGDRLLTTQGSMNTGQLCGHGGSQRSKKRKNKNKQGQRPLLVC